MTGNYLDKLYCCIWEIGFDNLGQLCQRQISVMIQPKGGPIISVNSASRGDYRFGRPCGAVNGVERVGPTSG